MGMKLERRKPLLMLGKRKSRTRRELQQKHTEDMKAQQDARDKEHELARKAQMSAEQRKLEEQSRAEKDGKKEAELEMKFNKKKSEEQQEKKDAAASALADRNAREQAIKDKSKAEAA